MKWRGHRETSIGAEQIAQASGASDVTDDRFDFIDRFDKAETGRSTVQHAVFREGPAHRGAPTWSSV